jgi:hypothetical protein
VTGDSDMDQAVWRKSSRSTHAGNCLEMAALPGSLVGVRDSKQQADPERAVLTFPVSAWGMFLKGVLAGEFDPGPGVR